VEDIPALCRHFLRQFNEEAGKRIQGFSPQALKKLTEYGWPGNIRELRNVIHRAVIFCQEESLGADLLRFPEGAGKTVQAPGRKPRSPFYLSLTKKEEVAEALKRNFGHASKTAKELNIARATLYKFIKQHGLNVQEFRRGLSGGR
jgi:DNA-binding NtrC family response regulator